MQDESVIPDESTSENPLPTTAQTSQAERKHAEHVRDLAQILFDRTCPLHDLGGDSRHVLELAALLQDMPLTQTKKKPYKAAREFVQKHVSEEIGPEDQNTLLAVITFHRGVIKKKDFSRLNLSPKQQREVLTIAALLRIAVGLDESHSQQTTIQQVELTRHEMWIVVDGPEATADAAVAQQNARLWAKIGYPEVKVMETAKAASKLLPFPEPTEKIGIEPTDSLAEAGRKVMRHHFAEMLFHESGTLSGENIEALHDMRVATRRLRAAFEVFAQAFEPGALAPHLKGLRATGRSLGAVRDLDVFMENAQHYLATLPEEQRSDLNPLLVAWEGQRDNARTQMLAHLQGQDYHTFKRKFNIFIHTPGAGARSIPQDQPKAHTVQELAPVLIYQRLAVVRAFDPFLADAPIERLHALRIEFKKLRYTVEYFQEALGKEAEEVVDDLKKLQDHLGYLNDAQTATQILREFIDAWEPQQAALPISERQNLEATVKYLATRHAERHRLMITFYKAWERFKRPEFRRNLARAVSVL